MLTSVLVQGELFRLVRASANSSLQNGGTYDPMVAYGQSNAARVMFAKSLGEKLKNEKIRVFSVDPGGQFWSCAIPASSLLTQYSGSFRLAATLPS